MRPEQEPGNSAKRFEPAVTPANDGGHTASVYLSVLLRFHDGAVAVEKINRVQGVLHVRRGLRQRRGLLVIAEDASGNAVHREVMLDPRPGLHEYVNDAGVLARAAASGGPEYALIRVPAAAHRLVIRDARRGALDGSPSVAESQRPAEPFAPDTYPLITTLELEVH